MKKILLISPHFHPEAFKCNDVAFELAQKGYDVTVLSDIPNYPAGKFFDGYGFFRRRRETVNGVKIIRTAVIPRGNGSGKMLALNYLSFAFTACIRALFMGIFRRYDIVLVHETSPITVGLPAVIIKKLQKKSKLLFWVLDLWPESLQAAGNINNKSILSFFSGMARMIYRNSDKILMSSKGFRTSILEKGDFEDKLVYFPNWAEDVFTDAEKKPIPELPEGFRLMFAGNIGEAQDFDNVMKAALELKDEKDVKFIIIGDGRKKPWVEEFIKDNGLEETVHLMGRHPLDTMPAFYEQADAMFLALKDEHIFSLTAPAKLQTYMAAKKPIIAMINGETRNLIAESSCGFSCASGDYMELAAAIRRMKAMTSQERESLGASGFNYFNANFTKGKCINHLIELLEQ